MLKYVLLSSLALFTLNSCITEYGIAHRSYPSTKLTVPYAQGKDTSSWYVGAAYASGSSTLGLGTFIVLRGADDKHESVQLNTHYGYQSKKMYYSLGVMGYKGVYDLQSFPIREIQGPLSIWGLAASTEYGLSFHWDEFNFRPVGLKVTALHESGDYAEFRRNYLDTTINFESYENGNPDNFSWNVSGVFGCSYHPGDWNYSMDIIMGVSDEDFNTGVNARLTYKNVSMILNYTSEYLKGRNAWSGGLMYRF